MRHPLRLLHGAGGALDLEVEVRSDATVGDLADQLVAAAVAHGIAVDPSWQVGDVAPTVVSRWPADRRASPPPRAAPLRTHGPRAGSTVVLTAQPTPPTPPPRSTTAPVTLVGPAGARRCIDYGEHRVGDTVVAVGERVTVRALGGSTARRCGAPLLGSATLSDGDLLTVAGVPWTVRVHHPLQPPTPGGWTRPQVGRAAPTPSGVPAALSLPTPPERVRIPRFPTLSAAVPLMMAIALWVATGSWLAAGFMVFSVVFVVASGIEARRDARAEDRTLVAEFRVELEDALAAADEADVLQRHLHALEGCSPAELSTFVGLDDRAPAHGMWARWVAGTAPAMTVRLGGCRRPREQPLVVPTTGRRELRRELAEVAAARSRIDDVATLDLRVTGGLVIEGDHEVTTGIARSVVAQLATRCSPDDLAMRVLVGPDRAATWRCVRWLPHIGRRRATWSLVVVDDADPSGPDLATGHVTDHTADRVTGASLGDAAPGDAARGGGTVVLWLVAPGAPHPTGVAASLTVGVDGGRLRVDLPGHPTEVLSGIHLEPLSVDETEPLARRLAGWHPAAAPALCSGGQPDASLQDRVALREVLAAPSLGRDPTMVLERWSGSAGDHLATPIGLDAGGGVVNVDLSRDGPHALIAGTTGAGKSELLRSLLVSAALHHPPDRLHLLLIDYKGGAAFGPLERLPHVVGSVTDLSGGLARRGLVALRAEVRRREQQVADLRTDRWTGPSLWVVVDELATLIAEQPDFVDGLVDVAQRGRSLGIHLVLATQRPTGVVTDAIRANVTLRIALRVADEDDSRDVVDVPTAAHLPREVPGRAIVRLGPKSSTTVQVAHTGAPATEAPAVVVHVWDAAPAQPLAGSAATTTELETAVAVIEDAATRSGVRPPRRPWLDPLPERIELPLADPDAPIGALDIGLVDRPDRQARERLRIDFARDGSLVVLGASGSGTTSAVRALAHAADRDHRCRWHVHVIDAGGAAGDLANVGSVGDVVAAHDTERVLRLLRVIDARIARGAPTPPTLPADGAGQRSVRQLLVVDGLGAFEERYERIDRGEAMELLARIARDGRAAAVHLVVTARRRAEVPPSIAGVSAARLLLRCATVDDAALLGLDDSAVAADLAPGRCHVGGQLGQVAWTTSTDPDIGEAGSGSSVDDTPRTRAPAVPRLPTSVDPSTLHPSPDGPDVVPVGLDGDDLSTVHLDLRHHHAVVAGPPRSGVSTTLRTLVAAHPRARLLVAPGAEELRSAVAWATAAAEHGHTTVVAVDGIAEVVDGPDGEMCAAVLGEVLAAARRVPVRLVLGDEVDALQRSYHEALAVVRRGRTGILLGDDPEAHGAVLHTSLRQRTDLPSAPGRGWLVGPGIARRVQVARS